NGKKVFPDEVEFELNRAGLFRDLCVVGTKAQGGPLAGTEEVCAIILPSEETSSKTRDEIYLEIHREVMRLSQGLAHYKRPSRIVVTQRELPRTSTRKVKRTLIRTWLDRGESAWTDSIQA
ncbi:MAG TPA: hypothetical protein VM598_10345, partial [Bdellovibrionota bacterium]|nr:hypothetical protein [Bdellovibrionota bacterium]